MLDQLSYSTGTPDMLTTFKVYYGISIWIDYNCAAYNHIQFISIIAYFDASHNLVTSISQTGTQVYNGNSKKVMQT